MKWARGGRSQGGRGMDRRQADGGKIVERSEIPQGRGATLPNLPRGVKRRVKSRTTSTSTYSYSAGLPHVRGRLRRARRGRKGRGAGDK
eukprot:scaffold208782_cov26-Tisochrysis_lutea.AAC.1